LNIIEEKKIQRKRKKELERKYKKWEVQNLDFKWMEE